MKQIIFFIVSVIVFIGCEAEEKTPRFEEEPDSEGELLDRLDRLEELETIVENAENAIDASTSKNLTLSMTFTNR